VQKVYLLTNTVKKLNNMTKFEHLITQILLNSPQMTFTFLVSYYLIKQDRKTKAILKQMEADKSKKE